MASDNSRMSTSAAELGRLLISTPNLVDFSFSSDDMVARAAQYSIAQGTIPDIGWSTMSPPLPLDCRIGEPCELRLDIIVGIQFSPMNSSEQHPANTLRHSMTASIVSSVTNLRIVSVGVNFEIRLDPNCTELDEHTLSLREQLFQVEEERDSNLNRSGDGGRTQGTLGRRRMAELLDPADEAEVVSYAEHQDFSVMPGTDEPLITLGDYMENLASP